MKEGTHPPLANLNETTRTAASHLSIPGQCKLNDITQVRKIEAPEDPVEKKKKIKRGGGAGINMWLGETCRKGKAGVGVGVEQE